MSYSTVEAPAEDFSMLVRQISIDKLQEEPKKLGPNSKTPMPIQHKTPSEALVSLFLKQLLRPKEWQNYRAPAKFPLKSEHIIELASECINIL